VVDAADASWAVTSQVGKACTAAVRVCLSPSRPKLPKFHEISPPVLRNNGWEISYECSCGNIIYKWRLQWENMGKSSMNEGFRVSMII